MFKKVDPKVSFPKMEEEILKFWEKEKIFKKSVEKNPADKPFVFYEGPPTANGTPGLHHVLARAFKDIIPRYKTMKGFRVERKAGWDTHGLPVELQVEKELGLKNKQEIENIAEGNPRESIIEFNRKCKESVWKYKDQWEKMTERMAYWVDMKNPYITYENRYIESVWWVIAQIFKSKNEKGESMAYKGHKVVPYCYRCGTTLSSHEVAQGYQKVKDNSIFAKFKLKYRAGKTGRGIGVVIVNEKGEVLLIRRNEKDRRMTWALPGGKVENEETFREAMEREVKEELGVEIASAKPFCGQPDIFEGRLFETVCYEVEIKGEPKIMLPEAMDKLEWFSLDNLPEINFPPSKIALEIYRNKEDKFVITEDVTRALTSVYALAWTTTPWTLPGNVALAVGRNISYCMVRIGSEFLILAKEGLEEVLKGTDYEFVKEIKGEELFGLEYESLYDIENKENKKAYYVVEGDFVTTQEGTGIVHIAPAFGADDSEVGRKYDLPTLVTVDIEGRMSADVPGKGILVKKKNDKGEYAADQLIIEDLQKRNILFKLEKYEHDYPFCWRCDTPLIYYAKPSWFIRMSELSAELVENNKQINWIPDHIKDGRFGEWLKDVKDWAISRERYWGTPLPVWVCEECGETKAVESIEEIRKQLGDPNKLFLMRHGEAENNVSRIMNSLPEDKKYSLTEKGKEQVGKIANELRNKKIEVIFSSPIQRTKETAEIIAKELGVEIIFDERLRETDQGSFNGKNWDEFQKTYPDGNQLLDTDENGVEGFNNLEARIKSFLEELNGKYQGKEIVIVSHGDPLRIMEGFCMGLKVEETIKKVYHSLGKVSVAYSKFFDLHKPFIDDVKLECSCGGEMRRAPEVLDVWFDSGSMPLAQFHYPNQATEEDKQKIESGQFFPAEYISEAIDQTRGWFYTLHAIATLLNKSGKVPAGNAYKNVICLGHILDAKGKKMSKSRGNVIDPMEVMDQYGADMLRWMLFTINQPGLPKKFDIKGMRDIMNRVFRMLWNSYSFFVMYANIDKFIPTSNKQLTTNNLLDKWIFSELNILIKDVDGKLEAYDIYSAAGLIEKFIDNLSNWYIRRSRKRFWKSENDKDKNEAYQTLHHVLVELSKLMAPFTPFIAEEIYRGLSTNYESDTNVRIKANDVDPISVHLSDFPVADEKLIDEKLNEEMHETRVLISLGLQLRADAGKKVRQPLNELRIMNYELRKELEDIVKEETNIKTISFIKVIDDIESMKENGWKHIKNLSKGYDILLDTNITEELKLEGQAREVIRFIQEMRKAAGYEVDNRIKVAYFGLNEVFNKFGADIAKEVLADELTGKEMEDFDLEKVFDMENERIKIKVKRATVA